MLTSGWAEVQRGMSSWRWGSLTKGTAMCCPGTGVGWWRTVTCTDKSGFFTFCVCLYFLCHLCLCFQVCMVQVSHQDSGWVRQSSYLLPTLPQDLYRKKCPFNPSVAKISTSLCNASHMWVVKPSPAPYQLPMSSERQLQFSTFSLQMRSEKRVMISKIACQSFAQGRFLKWDFFSQIKGASERRELVSKDTLQYH